MPVPIMCSFCREIELALQKGDVMDLGQRIQDMRNSLQVRSRSKS